MKSIIFMKLESVNGLVLNQYALSEKQRLLRKLLTSLKTRIDDLVASVTDYWKIVRKVLSLTKLSYIWTLNFSSIVDEFLLHLIKFYGIFYYKNIELKMNKSKNTERLKASANSNHDSVKTTVTNFMESTPVKESKCRK